MKMDDDSIQSGKEEYQNHPENFGSSLIGIDEQEFDRLNENLEQPINKEEFLSGKLALFIEMGWIYRIRI